MLWSLRYNSTSPVSHGQATAIDQLSPFEFVVCPRCMQSLAARAVEDGHCLVCLQLGPVEADIDPAAIGETRTTLQQQLQDAQRIQQSDEAHPRTAHERPQQLSFAVTSLRRQLDAQTRDAVAPRFDAIADASSRVAALKAGIEASQTLLGDLGTEFGRLLLTGWNLPCVTTAVIDPDTYLAVVNGQPFESLRASGGGIVTSVNLAYSLPLLAFGLDHADVLAPPLLVIDSPRRDFRNNDSNRSSTTTTPTHHPRRNPIGWLTPRRPAGDAGASETSGTESPSERLHRVRGFPVFVLDLDVEVRQHCGERCMAGEDRPGLRRSVRRVLPFRTCANKRHTFFALVSV